MITRRRFLILWLGGLAAFGVAIFLHVPLAIETVPSGITAHQTAGTGARVDYIQNQWSEAGVLRDAFSAMISDIAFILLYGFGSLAGGIYFLRQADGLQRIIGRGLIVFSVIFLVVDMTETVLQLQQLVAGKGGDTKAAIAAAMQYPKLVSWIACFVLPLNGLFLDWAGRRAA